MKKKTKLYLRLNLISLFFVVVSFMSVTLAWFVYSGLSKVSTEVSVKAWYIEMQRNGEPETNDITISLDEIYPGMEPIVEEVKIKNLGDSDAQVKYNIISARILDKPEDNYIASETITSESIEDKIAHEYPFHINIDLSKRYILAGTDEATFKVSISWPLDSGNDKLDSIWGTDAYKFKLAEQERKIEADKVGENYDMRASIRLDIELTAEQYIETEESSDMNYRLGSEILFDVVLNKKCEVESSTCLRTNVIDINNKIFDKTVTLLPKTSKEYLTGTFNDINTQYTNQITNWVVNTEPLQVSSWTVPSRTLNVEDILSVVSKDIKDSMVVKPNVSDSIIGNLKYEGRIDKVISDLTTSEGYFKYLNKFSYFYSNDCIWLNSEYNTLNGFAMAPLDGEYMKIYSEPKTSNCKVIPVIIAEKVNLEIQTQV